MRDSLPHSSTSSSLVSHRPENGTAGNCELSIWEEFRRTNLLLSLYKLHFKNPSTRRCKFLESVKLLMYSNTGRQQK